MTLEEKAGNSPGSGRCPRVREHLSRRWRTTPASPRPAWTTSSSTGSASSRGCSAPPRSPRSRHGAARLAPAAGDRSRPVRDPRPRSRGVPDRVHDARRDGLPRAPGLGCVLRSRARAPDGGRHRRRDAGGSVSTRGWRRCWTWSGTTAGAGPRSASARTRISSERSAPPTCRAWKRAGIVATLKHSRRIPSVARRPEHRPRRRGPREFADILVEPFVRALREGGARSVMNSYTDVDGVPAPPTKRC